MHIYHSAFQPFGISVCAKNPCTHLCLLSKNNTYTCACPKGMDLGVDMHSCKKSTKQQILLIGAGNRLISFEHQSFGRHNDGEGRLLQININKMAFNSLNGEVFVADNERQGIYTVNLETGDVKRIIWDKIGNVSALSFGKIWTKHLSHQRQFFFYLLLKHLKIIFTFHLLNANRLFRQ